MCLPIRSYYKCALLAFAASSAFAGSSQVSAADQPRQYAHFAGTAPSDDAETVANWVVQSGDNQGLSFIVVDKANAQLFLFDAAGSVVAATPVLLGVGVGDDSPEGIGEQPLSTMKPEDQITPSGRFVAGRGLNLAGQDILWVDYDAAISLHRASDRKPGMTYQSRTERLASATLSDNRASHGCINVSAPFYDSFIRPIFERAPGIVYVLPETRSVVAEFGISR